MIGGNDVSRTEDISVKTLFSLTLPNEGTIKANVEKQMQDEAEREVLPSAFQIHESLSMGPLSKWRKYRRVPFKLITHILLLILVSVLAILYTYYRQYFFRMQAEAFAQLFLPDNHMNIWESGYDNYIAYLTEYNDVLDDISDTVTTYYNLVNNSVDTILYLPKSRTEPKTIRPIHVDLTLWLESPRKILKNPRLRKFNQKLNKFRDEFDEDHPMGHNLAEIMTNGTRDFLDRMEYMRMVIEFQSLDLTSLTPWNIAECIQWKLHKTYEFHGSGSLAVVLKYEYDKCENIKYAIGSQFYKPTIWISLLLALVSLVSEFLNIKSVVKRVRTFLKLRQIQQQRGYSAMIKNLAAAEKLGISATTVRWIDLPKFMSIWFLLQFLADAMNISGFFLLLFDHIHPVFPSFVNGLGMLLTWAATLRFFQYAPSFYALIATIRNGVPNILRFLCCVLPLFIGFALSSTTIFGHYNRNFDDVQEAALSLFCMLNGDAIHDIFQGLFGVNPFLAYFSRFYVYCFCILFICMILNITILIMQDSFSYSREQFKERAEAETEVREHVRKSMRFSALNIPLDEFPDEDEEEKEDEEELDEEIRDILQKQNGKWSIQGPSLKYISKKEPLEQCIDRIVYAVSDSLTSKNEVDEKMLQYLTDIADLIKKNNR